MIAVKRKAAGENSKKLSKTIRYKHLPISMIAQCFSYVGIATLLKRSLEGKSLSLRWRNHGRDTLFPHFFSSRPSEEFLAFLRQFLRLSTGHLEHSRPITRRKILMKGPFPSSFLACPLSRAQGQAFPNFPGEISKCTHILKSLFLKVFFTFETSFFPCALPDRVL